MLTRAPLLTVLLVACPGEGPRPRPRPEPTDTATTATAPPEVPREIEVGTGDDAHHPLEGGEILLVYGVQQGFHIEVSGEVRGLGEIVVTRVWVEDQGQIVARGGGAGTAMRLGAYDPEARTGQFAGERAFLDNNALQSVCALDGRTLAIYATSEDLADRGTTAGGQATGIARIDPAIAYACGTSP